MSLDAPYRRIGRATASALSRSADDLICAGWRLAHGADSGQSSLVSDAGHDLSRVDELLFAGQRIAALEALREITGCSLQQAVEAIGPHCDSLVAAKPERFVVPLTDYWADFYSQPICRAGMRPDGWLLPSPSWQVVPWAIGVPDAVARSRPWGHRSCRTASPAQSCGWSMAHARAAVLACNGRSGPRRSPSRA